MPQPRRARLQARQRRIDGSSERILHALLDHYRLLREPRPLDDLLRAILETAVANVPGAQRGSLMVLQGDRLSFRATVGYNLEALQRMAFPAAMIGQFLGASAVMQAVDFASWDAANLAPEEYAVLREFGAVDEIRRSVIGKIFVAGTFYGTIVLDNLRTHAPFPARAETLTRLFAEQAGALLEHALLLEQLRQANTQLIEAERLAALGRFIASIAHEINNPLTAVLGYADFLADFELAPEPAGMLEQLREGAERVRTIVRNLQLFARQQREGVSQVSLNFLAEQALTLKRGELMLDCIDVAVELDPTLPYSWGDGGQLSQVLLNLLTNAQHALRLREPPRQLFVATARLQEQQGEMLELRVSDNGVGMTPELQARIFEPFFTTKPAGQGTGLGLSICQTIVSGHGGTISVETAPGDGATFTIRLPLRASPPEPIRPPEPLPPAPRPSNLQLLLVEDDFAVVEVVQRALGDDNEVVVAADGAQALGHAETRTFDLVLSDLRMPVMDGLEFFNRLSVTQPELAARLLFISGDTSSHATRHGLRATGRPLLRKPFRPEELYAAIAAVTAYRSS
jgi:two-component system NtrC family sensor kinase